MNSGSTFDSNSGNAAFPLLSRDDVMRKIISPRLWKHNVVACLLIAFPVILAGFQFPGQDREVQSRLATAARALGGLELFISSQLCLLICWVRSASAVDFAGVFRAWRWMSIILAVCSLLILTGLTGPLGLLVVQWLRPLFGNIQSARPALVFVPLCAASAYVLRHVIPDMSRCRIAQGSLLAAVLLTLGRIVVGIRGPSLPVNTLEMWELMIAGLVLSSIHLHGRYVIYVNPNPPVAKKQAQTASTLTMSDAEAAQIASKATVTTTEVLSIRKSKTDDDSIEQESDKNESENTLETAVNEIGLSPKKAASKATKSAKATKQRRAG
jgi:hypothetical protein